LPEFKMRLIEWASRHAMGLAGWCYLAMTVLICFDISARRLLGFSSESTIELSGYLMAIGMSWGLAGTLLERGHVRIDVLLQRMPLAWRVVLHLLSLAAMLVSIGFFIWGAFSLALDSMTFGSTDLSIMRTPLVVPQGLWAMGFALFGLAAVALMVRGLRQCLQGDWQTLDASLMSRSYQEEADDTLQALGAEPVDARTSQGASR
jgi:TRAP-type C4-dicarboxylate transport system permease small subunit